MIQRRAARWVLGRYDILDSVTHKQSVGLTSYECDKLQKEHKSRMDTIDLSSHVVHVIITRTLLILGQLRCETISHQN